MSDRDFDHRYTPLFKVHMPESVKEPLLETLFGGYIGQGPKVEEFEQKLAEYLGCPYVLTVNSGTAAIQLALRLAGVGYGDRVISTPMSCLASNQPILIAGAHPVWSDIDLLTGSIDPEDAERKITPEVKAIIVVHWGGNPVDLQAFGEIEQQYGVPVIEDAAHAFGAEYQGKKIGNSSRFTCFSFQAIKHLTTVDGGLLVCRDEADYRRGKLLRWYGLDRETPRRDMRCENDCQEPGYKFHMNDVNATIGIEQLKYVDSILQRHRDNAAYYDANLVGVRKAPQREGARSAYWLYTIHVESREQFIQWMHQRGVQVSRVHVRNDQHTLFRDYRTSLPGVDEFSRTMLCIPVGWWVNDAERTHVAVAIDSFSC